MSMMNFFVLTPSQVATSKTLDDNINAAINPRAIDNPSPGVGINLNNQASGIAAGATVTLAGNSVAPKQIVDDPAYQQYCPGPNHIRSVPWRRNCFRARHGSVSQFQLPVAMIP